MPSDKTNNESFVSRWSRRKQEVNHEELSVSEEPNESIDADTEEVIDLEELRERKLAELNALTDEDMPDIETLSEDSDYAGFMSVNVSEALRKVALQKLFHGKSYNIRDGLDEYDGDYTSFEKLDASIITADMRHLLEVEAEKLLVTENEKEEILSNENSDEAIELEESKQDIALNDVELESKVNEKDKMIADQNSINFEDEADWGDVEGEVEV